MWRMLWNKNYVGLYAQQGLGMKRDYDLARKYYRLGVLESDAYCYCQLGVMYALGQGVKKDAQDRKSVV